MKLSGIASIFTGNPWVYVGVFAAGLAVSGVGTYAVTSAFKNNTIKDLKLEATQKLLDDASGLLTQYTADATRIHEAASGFGAVKFDLDAQFAAIQRNFRNAINARPLPVGCAPDAVRLQSLSAAIAAANKARTAGQSTRAAVPGNP